MSRKKIERLQLKQLKNIVTRVFEGNKFYRKRLKDVNIKPSSIKFLKDLQKIPFTTKDDLQNNYPLNLLVVPKKDVIRLHTSSGTTGNPIVVAYTNNDIRNWANCIARCLTMTGVGKNDIFQVILGYGMFTGGLGFHYGAEKVGAIVVPSSTGNTKRQVKLMRDFGVTAFTSVPSYALYLADQAKQSGVDPIRDLKLKSISCGAEAWSKATRKKLEEIYSCSVFNSYGLSEVGGPGVGFECIQKNGLHFWEDNFIVELVDPKSGEPVEAEESGEIVLTTLKREAMPLLRYRTRDIARSIDEKKCDCGRSHKKLSWISGRTDDMVKIRGVNVFPTQVEDILMNMPGVGNNYQLILLKKNFLDELKIKVEVTKSIFSGDLKDLVALKERLKNELESALELRVIAELVEPGSIHRNDGKAHRVLDLR